MKTLKLLTVVGARPQFIKASAVSRAIKGRTDIVEVLVHTGQHHDAEMSQAFFDELELPQPKFNFGIHGGSHGSMTGRMLEALDQVLISEKPDWVLVYGDTNSTLAGALSAAKLNIPVAHVEAGLRSFNRTMPEEINRILVDQLSSLLFCPTYAAVDNLQAEGRSNGVHHVGDVMYDVHIWAQSKVNTSEILENFSISGKDFAFATVHRAESVDIDANFNRILGYLIEKSSEKLVVWPVHPRTRHKLASRENLPETLRLLSPLSFLSTCTFLATCSEVITDSGGLQKESYFARKPCTTLRSETEWVETVESGWNRLWRDPYLLPRIDIPDYGSGSAAEHILSVILDSTT